MTARRRQAIVALVATVAAGCIAAPSPAVAGKARDGAGSRPNVVMVVSDDQTLASFDKRTMPRTHRLLTMRGTKFTEAIATTPLCCPSRASLLTGQYGHNNGVLRNNYADLQSPANTLPVWLQRAGYRTLHVGKYLNRYADSVGEKTKVAPGWDQWHTIVSPRYYGYELQVNGSTQPFGTAPKDYLGRVLTKRSTRMARRHAPRRKPFFLQLDHFAPHTSVGEASGRCRDSAIPDPRDNHRFADEPLPVRPNFDEADVSDKPSFIRELPRLDEGTKQGLQRLNACALASLTSIDRNIAQLHRSIDRAGELDDTVFIFLSDNGSFAGEHRIRISKHNPYEEGIRVPLVISAPKKLLGRKPPRRVGLPVANIDLAPTILDLAGARPCRTKRNCRIMDGRSLLPLVANRPGAWPRNRAIAVELERRGSPVEDDGRACSYSGVRTKRGILVVHRGAINPSTAKCEPLDERELYDLRDDPFQLESLHASPEGSPGAELHRRLEAKLAAVEDCRGLKGRDPRPGRGRPWCQ